MQCINISLLLREMPFLRFNGFCHSGRDSSAAIHLRHRRLLHRQLQDLSEGASRMVRWHDHRGNIDLANSMPLSKARL